MANIFKKRLNHLRRELGSRGLDALLVTHAPDWFYLTGFTGEAGTLVVSKKHTTLVTDGRFTTQAKDETSGVQIVQHKAGLYTEVGEFLNRAKVRRIGFDSGQVTVAQHEALMKAAGRHSAYKPANGVVLGLRTQKDAQE